jgi:hypothetical protein
MCHREVLRDWGVGLVVRRLQSRRRGHHPMRRASHQPRRPRARSPTCSPGHRSLRRTAIIRYFEPVHDRDPRADRICAISLRTIANCHEMLGELVVVMRKKVA